MTKKQVIAYLKTIPLSDDRSQSTQARNIAIEAVKKQIPEKLKPRLSGFDMQGHALYCLADCPSCNTKFSDIDDVWRCNFCPNCGQALDWSECIE